MTNTIDKDWEWIEETWRHCSSLTRFPSTVSRLDVPDWHAWWSYRQFLCSARRGVVDCSDDNGLATTRLLEFWCRVISRFSGQLVDWDRAGHCRTANIYYQGDRARVVAAVFRFPLPDVLVPR